ncbi:hypothetical protein QBC44DRAFT_319206, partial [Cladorrhinum sp. PSN332]
MGAQLCMFRPPSPYPFFFLFFFPFTCVGVVGDIGAFLFDTIPQYSSPNLGDVLYVCMYSLAVDYLLSIICTFGMFCDSRVVIVISGFWVLVLVLFFFFFFFF